MKGDKGALPVAVRVSISLIKTRIVRSPVPWIRGDGLLKISAPADFLPISTVFGVQYFALLQMAVVAIWPAKVTVLVHCKDLIGGQLGALFGSVQIRP